MASECGRKGEPSIIELSANLMRQTFQSQVNDMLFFFSWDAVYRFLWVEILIK